MIIGRQWIPGMAAFSLAAELCWAPVAAQSPAPMPEPRLLVTEKGAVAAMPPQLIAAPFVRTTSLSPDGRFLLVHRESWEIRPDRAQEALTGGPPSGESTLLLWDSRSGASHVLWRSQEAGAMVDDIKWLPGTDAALVVTQEHEPPKPGQAPGPLPTRRRLLRVAGGRAQAETLLDQVQESYLHLEVSPTQPLAALVVRQPVPAAEGGSQPGWRHTLHLLGSSGPLGPEVPLPEGAIFPDIAWDEKGMPLVRAAFRTAESSKPSFRWFVLDPRTGTLGPLEGAPKGYQPPEQSGVPALTTLRITAETALVTRGGTTDRLPVLWLESGAKGERPRALLCGDCAEGRLLNDGRLALYHAAGALWVVPLVSLTLEQYQSAIEAPRRAQVLNRAKQTGLALVLLANDSDNVLPPAGDVKDLQALLAKLSSRASPEVLQGFVYTFPGGKLDSVDPATTELGHVDGPGGRAVIYADGHVVWAR